MIDQCPSTTDGEKRQPSAEERALEVRTPSRLNAAAGGLPLWRGLEEIADTREFRDFVEREFPAGASEMLDGDDRRQFLKIMGAGLALAGLAAVPGCRRPDHTIMPYSAAVPEETIPGKATYYATSLPLPGGGAEGVLVESHEGRPTKVEGNPLHPVNRGRSSLWAQSSVLELYDPDRLKFPMRAQGGGRVPMLWDEFRSWARGHLASYDASRGRGLAIIADARTSPTRDALRARIMKRWPDAAWIEHDPIASPAPVEGSSIAFGAPAFEALSLSKARVIASFDRNFACSTDGPMGMVNAREFAATRKVTTTKDSMSRLYVVEPGFSETGGSADHRLRVAPRRVSAVLLEVAKRVLANPKVGAPAALRDAVNAIGGPAGDIDAAFVNALADDLVEDAVTHEAGRAVVLVGASQPAWAHALGHALNALLGAVGPIVRYHSTTGESAGSAAALASLAKRMGDGSISTVVVVNANPLYDAPADSGFAAAFSRPTTITLNVGRTETGEASTYEINGAHWLESWGDTRAGDGTIAPIQPLIAPLYEPAWSEVEFLAFLAGDADPRGFDLVRGAWRELLGEGDFERRWRRALHDGVLDGTADEPATPPVDVAAVAGEVARARFLPPPSDGDFDAIFTTHHVHDGRFANVGWLQELPQVGTRVVWDNPALLSVATAKRLGLMPEPETTKFPEGRMATIQVEGRSVTMPVWILPGMADNTVILPLGYGRTACGLVGDGTGVNAYAVRAVATRTGASGVKVARAGGGYPISTTQLHWAIEDRDSKMLRSVDLAAWQAHGDEPPITTPDTYGNPRSLNFAERLGELSHTPPNLNIYTHPYQGARGDQAAPGSVYAKGPQWAMTIDLSTCTGCGVCTVACQAENNIPIVGKKEVQKGREMAWIRVDRYFAGTDSNDPARMLHQPVACVHCENAPCETVCPVNATVHGPEGINYMTYNRCIGTRYCANNCPYKVRRFNFFDFATAKYKGSYIGQEAFPQAGQRNPNLVPPRLREKVDQISRMQRNPDVTVRSRGVMEKCSFCIQRLNEARVEMKVRGLWKDLEHIPDGFVQTACQQACPSGAIVFGDMLDPSSAVHATRAHGRAYGLLGFLNTKPRLTYLARVDNPNPRLRAPVVDPFHHGGHDSHEGHEHDQGNEGGGHAASFRDPARRKVDGGYALSLRVLAGVNA